jgi:hypothetical protein
MSRGIRPPSQPLEQVRSMSSQATCSSEAEMFHHELLLAT